MISVTRNPVLIELAIVAFLGSWGCACLHSRDPTLPPPLAEQVRGTLGTIEVVSDPYLPIIDMRPPAKTPGEGARAGVAMATGDSIVVGSTERGSRLGDALGQCAPNEAGLFCAVGLSSFLVAAAAVGGAVGAVLAEPAARVEDAEASLKGAVVPMEIREILRNHVVQTIWERTSISVDSLQDPESTPGDGRIRHWSPSYQHIDATLKLRVRYVGLVGRGVNPRLTLLMSVGATLLRPGAGTVLYDHTFEYRSQEGRVFTEWAANHAQVFREEMDRAYSRLAGDIATQLFGSAATSVGSE